jgi:GH15 family glucan-1,4-alpha-glucosidase
MTHPPDQLRAETKTEAIDPGGLYGPHVLREYAVLADGERGALVGPHGDIVWMCAPRWDSDAVFSSLIGGGGVYAITPEDLRHVWGGYYEPDTLIWRSRWTTTTGVVECREALAFPGDPARVVLLRRILAHDQPVAVRILLCPAAGFGYEPAGELTRSEGVWHGRTGRLRWRWHGAEPARLRRTAEAEEQPLVLELTVPAGGHHDLVLELSETPLPAGPVDAEGAWAATDAAWARTTPDLTHSLAPRDAAHAYAVLRGLTSSGGGMVAAATMSLPERADAGRNYDYRYAWIRDQCYAGIAAAAAGGTELLDTAIGFVTARILDDGHQLKPAYTAAGGPVPAERALRLPGYPGGTDKLGNWVNRQFQLDSFGEALQLLATAAGQGRLDADGWRAVHTAVSAITDRWTEPEAGIWELHNARWTHSRLACVAGLRAVAALPAAGTALAHCSALADTILADTSRTSVAPGGHWQRCPEDPRLDAALLLPPVRGALPASDPRTIATVAAVGEQLTDQGYVYRFRHDSRELRRAEGAFLLCGFILALAQHHQGDLLGAARTFERNRAACGPPGLFSEEYDTTQRQLRGNLPQAFVHALMLETAVRLTDLDTRPGAAKTP